MSKIYSSAHFAFAHAFAVRVEDCAWGILSFIPYGLEGIYDRCLTNIPGWGRGFGHPKVAAVLKFMCGITPGKGIAADLAHFLFKPLGFLVGLFLQALGAGRLISWEPYHEEFSAFIQSFAFLTVLGAILGLGVGFALGLSGRQVGWLAGAGSGVGLGIYAIFWCAVKTVSARHGQTVQQQRAWAKSLNARLMLEAKQIAKSRILKQAQDIIQQMNGGSALQYLENFFQEKYDVIAAGAHHRIERHFRYLTDRACHGDDVALARLQALAGAGAGLEALLDRIFNARALAKLKDDVDTEYDRWYYRFLAQR